MLRLRKEEVNPGPRHSRPCGFTFQVQHLVDENFRRRRLPQACARRVVVRVNRLMKPLGRQGSHIGLAGQGPAQAADGAFDPALLPGGVRVAEEGFYPEGMEVVMPGELRATVEGDGLAAVGGSGARRRARV